MVDFFERLFDWLPDGGDGSLEFALFALPIAGLCWLAWRKHQAKAQQRQRNGDGQFIR